jgi:hypothetical protein
MKYCIILYDRFVAGFRGHSYAGYPTTPFDTYSRAQKLVKEWGYTEVPINSKIGRLILAKIGAQRP